MRVGLYTRVSTGDQSTAMQTDELKAYCVRRNWTIFREYTDTASGSKESREGLNQLLADARKRKFDVALVFRYDRFARSLRQLVNSLAEFDSLGINFVSLHEGVDTSTPNGKLVFGIFASIAEFERSLIVARTKSGIESARRRGKIIGRPRVTVDAEKIRALRSQGLSWDAVAEHTGIKRATCQRAIAA